MNARTALPILSLALACTQPSDQAPPEAAARAHLATLRRLPPDRLETAAISRLANGYRIARLREKIDGVAVYRSEAKVVMGSDGSLVAASGAPSRASIRAADRRFALSAGDALARALTAHYGVPVAAGLAAAVPDAPDELVRLVLQEPAPVRLAQPAGARKVYYPIGDRLIPAYHVEFISGRDAYAYLVAAEDGRVLERHSLTASDSFRYRVYASDSGDKRPLDGPIEDFTPHPTGQPDGSEPAFAPPHLVEMDSFKKSPDPWLPAGATETRGNNVDAYADLQRDDGFTGGDLRATTTAPGVFDRSYDVTLEPNGSQAQIQAAITNVFYDLNWLHDYWYDSGFDEAAGNAQVDNFGRRGIAGDPIHAEVHDFDGLNNANMATPFDGFSPRMQMYLWSPFEVASLASGGTPFGHRVAQFGAPTFDVEAELVRAAPATDACQRLGGDVAGKIVLVDRGTCTFASKALKAQNAGAAGVLIANSSPGLIESLGNQVPPLAVDIPVFGISGDDGAALAAAIARGPTTVHLIRHTVPPGRDGAIDNMVVAHEWGHYLHHRLSDCVTAQCDAASEGFADFVALHLVVAEGDDLDGTYGMGIYAPRVLGDTGYFGIRRFPYSVDFTKNALTFQHMAADTTLPPSPQNPNGGTPNEAHNAGEVWATMLFEAYVAVHKASPLGFSATKRLFADALVLGLELAPQDATYLEYRDSILAAFAIVGPDRFLDVAQAFARRGAGTCAVGPDRFGDTFEGISESFALAPVVGEVTVAVDDSVQSCDHDGILDVGETGRVSVSVVNSGAATLHGAQVTVASTRAGVTFPQGPSVTLADVPRLGTGTAEVAIALGDDFVAGDAVNLTVTVESQEACVTQTAVLRTFAMDRDEVAASSRKDDVEAAASAWTASGGWTREAVDASHHVWHGDDAPAVSDTQLVSPELRVGAGPFRVSFKHAYDFDFADATHYDGGVVELSKDGGATWQDVETFGADPHYNAAAIQALGARRGYGRANARYPDQDEVTLDFGTALAGETVKLRFRVGTDDAVGGPGWRIDDIAAFGTTNLPFTEVAPNAGTCGAGPPDAGTTPRPDAGPAAARNDEGGCSVAGGASADRLWLFLGLAALLLYRGHRSRSRPA